MLYWKGKKMIVRSGFLTLLVMLAGASLLFAETPEEKGLAIMQKIEQLPVVEKMLSETEMDIYDGQGKILFSKQSRIARYTENFRDADKRLSRSIGYFFAPADDKGNGSLMIEIPKDDDEQWIYLKGLRKPKRIVGSDKSSSFMGSDFSNGDIGPKDIEDYDYTWLGLESVSFKGKNIAVEKIQTVFKSKQMREDYGYSKSIIWIHSTTGLVFKGEMYNLEGQLEKTSTLIGFNTFKNRDDKTVFMPAETEMRNLLKGTKTHMKFKNIRVEKDADSINPEFFKVEYLTRRWW